MSFELHLGNCLDILASMPDNSIDAIVTDPPYGLAFMGKKWDYDVPSEEIWQECLRVLKPGGHLLAFAGTRTQHRMAVRIEDAGFEIRDMIAWVYGSGFPKSHDISKAIDKGAGTVRERVRFSSTSTRVNTYAKDKWTVENVGTRLVDEPITPAAKTWQGWGTALKPALEPITVARKPFTGTVAANVLQWGTGGVNVDGCRVGYINDNDKEKAGFHGRSAEAAANSNFGQLKTGFAESEDFNHRAGRFPANLIQDGSDEVVGMFPQSEGKVGMTKHSSGTNTKYGKFTRSEKSLVNDGIADSGSAARFFYCAKASKADRGDGNHHPTVKPTDLMRYLCRLVTPPNGTVLDPFMGSGSTGKAAILEGLQFIGIDMTPEYVDIARARIEHAVKLKPNKLDLE
jgi:site-specific DNA-methyltransferase (adenine-specific)